MPTLRAFLLTLLLAAAASPAAAQQPPSLDAVLTRYLAARSYCEEGRVWFPNTGEVAFNVCADNQGRFKHVSRIGQPEESVAWSEGALLHSWRKDTRAYGELRRDTPAARGDGYGPGRPPAAMSQLLRESLIRPGAVDSGDPFKGYAPSPALSSPTHTVFERRPPHASHAERIWLRHADGVLTRYEHVAPQGAIVHWVELAAVRIDAPLAPQDLAFRPGFFERHNLRNSPWLVQGALVAFCLAAAIVAWTQVYRRVPPERLAHLRSRAWWWWRRVLIVAVAVLASMTVLAVLMPGSGHPPAIVVPMLLGWLAGMAFAFAAAVLLASYPAEWLARRRRPYAASL